MNIEGCHYEYRGAFIGLQKMVPFTHLNGELRKS